jgi:hypothetical protein
VMREDRADSAQNGGTSTRNGSDISGMPRCNKLEEGMLQSRYRHRLVSVPGKVGGIYIADLFFVNLWLTVEMRDWYAPVNYVKTANIEARKERRVSRKSAGSIAVAPH